MMWITQQKWYVLVGTHSHSTVLLGTPIYRASPCTFRDHPIAPRRYSPELGIYLFGISYAGYTAYACLGACIREYPHLRRHIRGVASLYSSTRLMTLSHRDGNGHPDGGRPCNWDLIIRYSGASCWLLLAKPLPRPKPSSYVRAQGPTLMLTIGCCFASTISLACSLIPTRPLPHSSIAVLFGQVRRVWEHHGHDSRRAQGP